MTINLRPEHERLITDAMRTGWARPCDAAEDEELRDQKESIRAKIERAFEQFERGEFLSAEESRADMDKRKAAWHAEQRHG